MYNQIFFIVFNTSPTCVCSISPAIRFFIGFGIRLLVSAIRSLLDALPTAGSLMLSLHSEVMSLSFHDQASTTNWYSCKSSVQYYSVQIRDNS